jgi:acyl dehydratase
MGFNVEALGVATKENVFRVERDRIVAFARATNDPDARALSGDAASPLFSVIPMYRPLAAAIRAVTPADRIMYTLHGEQDMRFFSAIRPGMELHATATPVGFAAKSSGTTISILGAVTDEHGSKLCEQWMSMFIRGAGDTLTAGAHMPPREPLEPENLDAPVALKSQVVDADQTFRFAEASGDPMRVHLDAAVARKFGLPGIICHGLCTMAMAGNAAIAALGGGSPQRMKRLAVRFAKPLLPGQEIVSSFWSDAPREGNTTYRFQTEAADRTVVLSNGVVELAPV